MNELHVNRSQPNLAERYCVINCNKVANLHYQQNTILSTLNVNNTYQHNKRLGCCRGTTCQQHVTRELS